MWGTGLTMKSAEEWAPEIIKYLSEHPITTAQGATLQIQKIVEWVQKDALAKPVEEPRH